MKHYVAVNISITEGFARRSLPHVHGKQTVTASSALFFLVAATSIEPSSNGV